MHIHFSERATREAGMRKFATKCQVRVVALFLSVASWRAKLLYYLLMGNAIVEQGLVPARLGVKAGFSVSVIAWASRDYCQL
jgi:hypothetical protein